MLWLALALVMAACGASRPAEGVGTTHEEAAPVPVELELRTPAGAPIFIGDLRGRPVLLFLFATFDGVSQASLRPLSRFVRHHPEVHVVGIAVQPGAEELLDAWAHALSPRFTVAYDPHARISTGTSDLGAVDQIPTYILLDTRGLEADRHVGFASERKLERMLFDAGPRVRPTSSDGNPPLLAE